MGIRVPELRRIARSNSMMPIPETAKLLQSEFHEERLTALFILAYRFSRANSAVRKEIYQCYLQHLDRVNNWDLVDSSAPKIMGPYLEKRDRSVLFKLAKSENIWHRRVAVMSCHHFIGNGDVDDALEISRLLLYDDHDLIQKAVGWTLREIGKRDMTAEEAFLQKHDYRTFPRVLLRYAIEKFPEPKRKSYLDGNA